MEALGIALCTRVGLAVDAESAWREASSSHLLIQGDLLRLRTYAGYIVVDRSDWHPNAIRDFDTELSVCLDWVRDRWAEGKGGAAPRIYALARCEDTNSPLVVRDPRMLCVAVSVSDEPGRAAAAPLAAAKRR